MKKKYKADDKLWDSSDDGSSSEEDFAFLHQKLEKSGKLNDMETKLLAGVVMPPAKEYKTDEKARLAAEAGRKRAQRGFGEMDSDDDTVLGSLVAEGYGSRKVAPMEKSHSGKGFIKKDGNLDIDHPDWAKLSREEQLRLLHKQAVGFNFYAMDKPN